MKSLAVLLAYGKQNAAYRLNRPAFTPDDAAHIAFGHAHLNADIFAIDDLVDLNRVLLAYKAANYLFDRILHSVE
jgi:hypothetical protein